MKNTLILALALLMAACVPKSELEQTQTENKNLNDQISHLKQQVAELQSKQQEANSQLAATQAELSRKPAMPVTVSFHKALIGAGYVAVFNTTIKQDFPVLVTITSKALGTTQRLTLNLSQATARKIGHLEGAAIEAGDEIVVGNTNYEPLSVIFTP